MISGGSKSEQANDLQNEDYNFFSKEYNIHLFICIKDDFKELIFHTTAKENIIQIVWDLNINETFFNS